MLQFSEAECVEIVKKITNKNVQIVNFASEQFGSFLGYSGEYYRFKITAIVFFYIAKMMHVILISSLRVSPLWMLKIEGNLSLLLDSS